MARIPSGWPLAALLTFAVLLGLAVGQWPPLDHLDAAISTAARRYGTGHPGVIGWVRVATDIAATVPFMVAGALASALLAVRGDRAGAGCCAAVAVVVPACWSLLHLTLHRPRPVAGFVTITSNGFPSGHSANAAAAGLVAVLLLWHRLGRGWRIVVVLGAIGLAGFVGVTRVLLLAHWPADVVAGWLLSVAIVPPLGWAAAGFAARRRRAGGQRAPSTGRGGVAGRTE